MIRLIIQSLFTIGIIGILIVVAIMAGFDTVKDMLIMLAVSVVILIVIIVYKECARKKRDNEFIK